MSTLYIIGASVDNLEDISLTALRILGEADFILSQEAGLAEKLLARYKVKTRLLDYGRGGDERLADEFASWLAAGKNIVLVSESGLPGISDLGGKLALEVIERFGGAVSVEFIPNQPAITAALSLSGLAADKFIFLGWPPRGASRPAFMRQVLESDYPAIIYESRPGLEFFLKELNQASRENRATNKKGELEYSPINLIIVVVYRELEKMRETVYRGDVKRIIEKVRKNGNDQEGEFIVIIGK